VLYGWKPAGAPNGCCFPETGTHARSLT